MARTQTSESHPISGTKAKSKSPQLPRELRGEDKYAERPSAVTIGLPLDQIFAFFREFSNHPLFMKGLRRAEKISPQVTHWIFEREGRQHEWDSEVVVEEANRTLAWKSMGDTEMGHYAVATFQEDPGGKGCIVTLKYSGDKKPGKVTGVLAYFLGKDSKSQAYTNLRRLKAYLETGEVPTVEGQPNGRDEDENLKKQ